MFLFLREVVLTFIFKDLLHYVDFVVIKKALIQYTSTLSTLNHINVVNEKKAVFAKKCCEPRKRQLDKYKKSLIKIVLYTDVACFSSHCETDCQVCKKLQSDLKTCH